MSRIKTNIIGHITNNSLQFIDCKTKQDTQKQQRTIDSKAAKTKHNKIKIIKSDLLKTNSIDIRPIIL